MVLSVHWSATWIHGRNTRLFNRTAEDTPPAGLNDFPNALSGARPGSKPGRSSREVSPTQPALPLLCG